ncbi:hypothetical protein PMAYCL1PPCAC_24949, partial [Pristionchus mayeri]
MASLGKLDAVATADAHLSGLIRFEVDELSSLDDEGKNSPEIEVGGVPWAFNVCNENGLRF